MIPLVANLLCVNTGIGCYFLSNVRRGDEDMFPKIVLTFFIFALVNKTALIRSGVYLDSVLRCCSDLLACYDQACAQIPIIAQSMLSSW